jgi:MoaA/NifB/PqqE/SkfB family radical SAM enzyme
MICQKDNFFFWLSHKIGYPLVGPQVMQVALTYRCNLKCKICHLKQLLPQEEELAQAQVEKLLDGAVALGVKELVLTGGEPLLRSDIFDICRYAAVRGLKTVLTTNGTLLDEDVSKKLADSGVAHVHISMDGLKATHDHLRGSGTFGKIVEGIGFLNEFRFKKRFFSLGVACTVMDVNAGELSKIAAWADEHKIDVINFQPILSDNADFTDCSKSSGWVQKNSLRLLKDEIEKIKTAQYRHVRLYEEPSLNLLVKYYDGTLTQKDWVCFGGFKTLFVCFSHKIPYAYSCHGLCGDLSRCSLKKAWRSKEAHELRRHSKTCTRLCLQACYSKIAAGSLKHLAKQLCS